MSSREFFKGEWAFLSNCHPSDIKIGEYHYPSVEHYYQSMKTNCPEEANAIRLALEPLTAKDHAKKIRHMKPDWDDIRVSVMREGVRAKFRQNPDLAQKLLATGDRTLEEGNTRGDLFWGVDYHTHEGENWLGKILMQVREEIKR